jgi:hypothetical protein
MSVLLWLSFMSAKYERKLGEIALCRVTMAEAISLAKELNDTHSLALALWHAAYLAHYERDPAEVERSVSDLIELSMRHNLGVLGDYGSRSPRLGTERFR